MQKLLEGLVVFSVLCAWYALYFHRGVIGAYIYWIPAIPLVFGFLLAATVSRITKHDIYLKCSLLWAIFFLVAGFMLLLWGYWQMSLPCFPLAYMAYTAGRIFSDWKVNKIGLKGS
jgi:hypothetical protein